MALSPEEIQAARQQYGIGSSASGSSGSAAATQPRDHAAMMQRLDKVIKGQSQAASAPTPSAGEGMLNTVANGVKDKVEGTGNFLVGAAKGVMDLPREAASLGSSIGKGASDVFSKTGVGQAVQGAARSLLGNTGNDALKGAAEGLDKGAEQTSLTKPEGTAQNIGFGAEKVGEFFTPLGAEAKVGALSKVGSALEHAPALVKKGADFLAHSGVESLDMMARTALQSGGDAKATKEAGMLGAAGPLIGKTLGTLGSIGSGIAKSMSSKLSGVPTAAIEHAFTNPEATQKAIRTMAKDPEMGPQKVLASAEEALDALKNVRREEYRGALKAIEDKQASGGRKFGLEGIDNLKNQLTKTFAEFGGRAKGNAFDLSKVALPNAQKKELQEVVEKIHNWDDMSPTGLDDLRENLSVFRKGGVAQSTADKKYNAIIDSLLGNLKTFIKKNHPEIAKMNEKYHAQSDTIHSIMQELSLGKDKPVVAMRKLTNAFNPKSEVYRDIVKTLGDKAGKDLMSDIAGLTMSKWTPEGLGAYLSTGIGSMGTALGVLSHPTGLATVVGGALASSPRVIGETAAVAGKAAKSGVAKTSSKLGGRVAKGVASQVVQAQNK